MAERSVTPIVTEASQYDTMMIFFGHIQQRLKALNTPTQQSG
eukprot:CAMPEP_0194186494 /NCGR_PEP_ID=MMETSP0154-20130528/47353_1 /TAXON_ID=1049557 /ORGANISM="Thalassiothrix antarctica, Strain L6-D1" /LENGTH=41 /DNA_ID= /DNA_START= /DNA_END= /DNA_ORIENTATION=